MTEQNKADAGAVLREQQKLMEVLAAVKANNPKDLFDAASRFAAEKNATVDHILAWFRDGNGRNALHFAANFGYPELCTQIVEKAPTSLEIQDREGATPLYLAVLGANPQVTEALLDKGANIDAAREDGDTPIHLTARYNYEDITEILCRRGANLSAKRKGNNNVFHDAAREGATESVKVMLQHLSMEQGQNKLPGEQNSDRKTPLILTAEAGHGKTALALLEAAKASEISLDIALQVQDTGGYTALHYLAKEGFHTCISYALELPGSDDVIEMQTKEHLRPLEIAAGYGHREIAELLAARCGVTNEDLERIIDEQQKRVASEASRNSHSEVVVNQAAKQQQDQVKDTEMLEEVDMSIPLPPEPTEEGKEKAAEAKQRGNNAFIRKNYEEAIDAYTEAIELDGRNEAYYGNRCACYLKLNRLEEALADAKLCRRCQPEWPKGCYRHGTVLMKMERYEDAANVFYAGYKLDTNSKELADAFRDAIQKGREQYKRNQQQTQ
eukprot:gb/GECG01009497.1/.p1 GENE.gb/GECG01009497.1/~~gb/GECG01009497.1/.p1  ORF type:complete len:499 (+),score=90.09 gb/GECG01009497.1/:1-1497(+)